MNETGSKPLVSIGMPVYNGEKYIRQALDSLLAQDYGHFELIISDNASTDGTAEICREYVAKDDRIRYCRNETNLGAVRNFNRVFELSSGKYFMWAATDNMLSSIFISCCFSLLQQDLRWTGLSRQRNGPD
jgi:glycosyltransferase involved in cell wall biosynthesis